jgi:hypothetical protein
MSLQLTMGTLLSFTGTPSAAGMFNGSVTVRDSAGAQVVKPFSITINPPITFALAALPHYNFGMPYSQTLNAVNGGIGPITFQYALSGPLPAGMTLVNGVLSGTSTNATPTDITVTATDAIGAVTVKIYTLTPGLNARRRGL